MRVKLYPVIFFISIAVLVYMTHMQMTLNGDVASLLYDTELFLSGGTYVKDFFETNPPMIFILYSPIVILQKITDLNVKTLVCLYVIFCTFISLTICNALLKRILSPQDFYLRRAMIFVLMVAFLVIPVTDFGQREHVLFILGMPYLLAVVARAKGITISVATASLIGLMGGLVFSLKPFFLIPIILIECYLMVVRKSIRSWVRVESLLILGVMVTYITYVLMPLISQFYFPGTSENWLDMLARPRVKFCIIIALYYVFFFQKKNFRELSQVLFLSFVGFVLAFVIPRSAWAYHVFPAYCIALLLTVIYIYSVWSKDINELLLKKKEIFFIVTASFALPLMIFLKDVVLIFQISQSDNVNVLREKIKTLPYHSVYCFSSTSTSVCFPFVTQNNKVFAGRFPMFWWLRGVRKMENMYGDLNLPPDIIRERDYLVDAIADDLNHYQPELIITYKMDETFFLPKGYDYPAYFSKRESFKMAWQHYQFLEDIGQFRLYRRI
jgi:hypothetical protein